MGKSNLYPANYCGPAASLWKGLLPLRFFLLLSPVTGVLAHDFWIEQTGNEYVLVFGHGSNREDYPPEKIKGVRAFDGMGKGIAIQQEKRGKGILLTPAETPALLAVEIDSGYWSKTIYGWKNLPKRKAVRVVEGIRTFHYTKALLSRGAATLRPMEEFALDIVPLADPFSVREGDTLAIQVFLYGKPLPDIEVTGNNHQQVAATDREGTGRITLAKGRQLLSVTHKEARKGDPDADFTSFTVTVTFEVRK